MRKFHKQKQSSCLSLETYSDSSWFASEKERWGDDISRHCWIDFLSVASWNLQPSIIIVHMWDVRVWTEHISKFPISGTCIHVIFYIAPFCIHPLIPEPSWLISLTVFAHFPHATPRFSRSPWINRHTRTTLNVFAFFRIFYRRTDTFSACFHNGTVETFRKVFLEKAF